MAVRTEPGRGAARVLWDTLRGALEKSTDVDEGVAAYREGRPPEFTDQ